MYLFFPHAFALWTMPSKTMLLTFDFLVEALSRAGQAIGTCGASIATHDRAISILYLT
jgi:hypothetical protein